MTDKELYAEALRIIEREPSLKLMADWATKYKKARYFTTNQN